MLTFLFMVYPEQAGHNLLTLKDINDNAYKGILIQDPGQLGLRYTLTRDISLALGSKLRHWLHTTVCTHPKPISSPRRKNSRWRMTTNSSSSFELAP